MSHKFANLILTTDSLTSSTEDTFNMEEFLIKVQLENDIYKLLLFVTNDEEITYRHVAEILSNAFTYKDHAMTTFQFFTDMRWFRGHAEAPRLLRLSPLRADEEVNEVSYHFRARSRCRGKALFQMRSDLYNLCGKNKITLP